MAQFDKSGYLTGIAQSAERSRTIEDTDKTVGNVLLVAGEVTESASDGWANGSQKRYDPSWASALALLDHLEAANLISRDLEMAAVGQIVLCSGDLQVTDLLTMAKTWELPTVRKLMDAAVGASPPRLSSSQRKNPELAAIHDMALKAHQAGQDAMSMFRDMVRILPHTIQAKLVGSENVWCSLRQDGMTVDSSDIMLKYGISVPGTWHMLGILDARLDGVNVGTQPNFSDGTEMASKLMGIISPIARQMLGRPPSSYGVTPLLIFRSVTS